MKQLSNQNNFKKTLNNNFFCFTKTFILFIAFILSPDTIIGQVTKENKLLIGRIELSNKNYQEAIESFNIAANNEPFNFEPLYYRSIAKIELGDVIGSFNDINKAIELEPRNVDLYILRGSVNDRLFNYEKAFEDFNKAISIDHKNPDIYLSRAITYSNLDDHINAIKDCESALKYRSKKELIYTVKGMSEIGLKDYEKAINDFNIVIENSPYNSTNYVRRATAYYFLEDYVASLSDIQKSLYLDAKNSCAYFQRSMIYNKQNKREEALKDLNKLIELSPNSSSAYYNRALIFTDKGALKSALKDYNMVLTINNKNILAYFNRAVIYQKLKNNKLAKADVEKAIELYPDFVDAYKLRSSIRYALGDYKGGDSDKQTAEIINQSKINITDSLKQAEELLIAKITSFSSGNSSTSANENFKNNDISLLSSYEIQLFSNYTNKRIIDSWNNTKKGFTSYFLVNANEMETSIEQFNLNEVIKLNQDIERNSNDAELYLKRAILFASINKYDNSLKDFNQSLALDSTNYISYYCRANLIYKLINDKSYTSDNHFTLKMVLIDYAKCIQENPNFSFVYFNRGNVKFEDGKYLEAIDDYTASLKVNPNFAESYFNRGLILLVLDNREQACKDFSKAGELGFLTAYDVIAKYCN